MTITLCGIDPDLSGGGITVTYPERKIIDAFRMPVYAKKPPLNEPARVNPELLHKALIGARRVGCEYVVIERPVVKPQIGKGGKQVMQGGIDRTHQNFGAIRAVSELAFTKSRVRIVNPSVWKKEMGLSSDKPLSREMAIDLFPSHKALFRMAKNTGLAEAALIAEWGKSKFLTFTG